MRSDELRELLAESGALRDGHFRLSSGLHSSAYVQCALLLENPRRARRVAEALAERLREFTVTAISAPALGGMLIGHEIAAALDVPFRFTERSEGKMTLRRGFQFSLGEPVVVVEDVVTTGRSSRECQTAVEEAGGRVVGFAAVLDRSGGGHGFTLPFHALLDLDLPAWPADDCPLCRDAVAIEKPGSRVG